MRIVIFVVLFASFFNVQVLSQWESNGPSAVLSINGNNQENAYDDFHWRPIHAPGLLRIRVESGANTNMGVILASSASVPLGQAVANYPGIGILNLGQPATPVPSGIRLLADGIGLSVNPASDVFFRTQTSPNSAPPRVELAISISAAAEGFTGGVQALVQDPASAPFGLDFTECARIEVVEGVESTVLTGANGSVAVNFEPGRTFTFHGVTYTGLFVSAEGHITFGAPPLATPAFITSHLPVVGGPPAIFGWYANFTPSLFSVFDGVRVVQSDEEIAIRWGHPSAHPSGASGITQAGLPTQFSRFSIHLIPDQSVTSPHGPPGSFFISYEGIQIPSGSVVWNRGLIGHTPGGASASAAARDVDLDTPATRASGLPTLSEAAIGLSPIGYDRTFFSPRRLFDMRVWDGRTLRFTPATTASGPAYSHSVNLPPPDHVEPVVIPISNLGPQVVTVVGRFFGFDQPQLHGSVVLDPQGLNISINVLGVLDSASRFVRSLPHSTLSSPLRNGEGLVLEFPDGMPPVSSVPLEFRFASGFITALSANIHTGSLFNQYILGANNSVQHQLVTPVSYYGQVYSGLWISSDGVISFNSPVSGVPATPANFFGPGATGPNPLIAAAWGSYVPTGGAPLGIRVLVEESPAGEVSVEWSNLLHSGSLTLAGTFGVGIDPNLSVIAVGLVSYAPATQPGGSIISGFSDQGPGANVPGFGGNYFSTTPDESLALIFPAQSIPPLAGYLGVYSATFTGSWEIY